MCGNHTDYAASIFQLPRLGNSLRCTFSAAKTSRLAFLLTDHFGRILVFPEAEKHRLTEPIVSRPFREFDLTNHRRLNPNTTPHFCGG